MSGFARQVIVQVILVVVFKVSYSQAQLMQSKTHVGSVDWYNPMEEPFQLMGFEWIKKEKVFRRLPVEPEWKIPKAVDDLANQTAGGQLRFQTNSNRIYLEVCLSNSSNMYHMPATGQSGFDVYVEENGVYRYLQTSKFPFDAEKYSMEFMVGKGGEFQDFRINFPLYNGVKDLRVGVEENAVIKEARPLPNNGKIVVYGTSITQGGCVSRPGMVYSNILSRKLDIEFVNLGFSGNGRGEPELAHLINQISSVRLVVLDYEANANQTIQNTIGPFVDILRSERPTVPILIMSKIRVAYASDGSEALKKLLWNRDFLRKMVADRKNRGDKNIYFVDGSVVLGADYFECTVDRIHPTDLGSYRIAQALLGVVQKILKI
ncbi:SGNH/GDSL hydrolase family protein [Flagellimonas sp.]|uniref:SGNH/GDSL hydrolase family protein n=1 Tax=Flagellimonas sp. TaxID=2058762 RepID=UPI003BAE8CD9